MRLTVLNRGVYLEARSIATRTRFALTKYRIGSSIHVCQLLDVRIKSSGAGYNSTRPPLCHIEGDGTGAAVELTVFQGCISKAVVKSPGSGYSYMTATVIDPDGIGDGATIDLIFGPAPDYTDVVDFVYEGDPSSLALRQISDSEVAIIVNLEQSIGDFDIGNIVYFTDDDIPFAMGAMARKIPKIGERNRQVGNGLTLNATVKISNVVDILDINVLHTTSMDPAAVSSAGSLPDPITSLSTFYIVAEDERAGRPTLAFLSGKEWWTIPTVSPLSNAVYGDVFDAGINHREGADVVLGGASYRMVRQGLPVFQWRRAGTYEEHPVAYHTLGEYSPAPPIIYGDA